MDEQMCCCLCGHFSKPGDTFETEPSDDGEGFPICPKCGEFNSGGYSSYALVELWPEDMIEEIREI